MSEHIADLVSRKDLRVATDDEVKRLAALYEVPLPDQLDLSYYLPPGPVAAAFILSTALTPVIMGPLGGGKTTACVFKRIYAGTQAPLALHPDDGVLTRMCRWAVVRDTFVNVERSVLESWKMWFPKTYPGSKWLGGSGRPAEHVLRFRGVDGVRIEMATLFMGLNEHNVAEVLKGSEWSGVWLNELDTQTPDAIDNAEQRVGRWPPQKLLVDADAERQRYVIGDLNAPTMDNWTYEGMVTKRPAGRAFFQQPSGRSPEAENRTNLPPDYYQRIIENQPEAFVRRMVDNEFGYSLAGKPVHPSFDRRRHVATEPIPFDPRFDLLLGVDLSTNSLTPAALFGQNDSKRLRIIDEFVPGQGVGAGRFVEGLHNRLNERYGNARRVRLYVDPAALYGGDKEGDQLSAVEALQRGLGVPVLVPFNGSNELGLRLSAVDMELRGYMEPDTWMVISPSCPIYIEAMGGRYRYKKLSSVASNEFDDKPEKSHPWSDIADGGQYLIGGLRGRQAVIQGGDTRTGADPHAASTSGGWSRPSAGGGGFDPRMTGL